MYSQDNSFSLDVLEYSAPGWTRANRPEPHTKGYSVGNEGLHPVPLSNPLQIRTNACAAQDLAGREYVASRTGNKSHHRLTGDFQLRPPSHLVAPRNPARGGKHTRTAHNIDPAPAHPSPTSNIPAALKTTRRSHFRARIQRAAPHQSSGRRTHLTGRCRREVGGCVRMPENLRPFGVARTVTASSTPRTRVLARRTSNAGRVRVARTAACCDKDAGGTKTETGQRRGRNKDADGRVVNRPLSKVTLSNLCVWVARVVMFRPGPEAAKPRLSGSASRARAEPTCGPEPAFGPAWHSSRPSRKAPAFREQLLITSSLAFSTSNLSRESATGDKKNCIPQMYSLRCIGMTSMSTSKLLRWLATQSQIVNFLKKFHEKPRPRPKPGRGRAGPGGGGLA
ncbi:hypothetical protein C8R45DRAFT_924292 [Mycena sanguinolenta]|nr:hypothetical protein C8R45DRAFT_924292 [Mycena sanguinolenta]